MKRKKSSPFCNQFIVLKDYCSETKERRKIMTTQRIHPIDLFTDKNVDLCILDVRTSAEVATESIPDCLHIPLHELTPERLANELAKRGKDAKEIHILCQSGKRAEMAVQQLQGQCANGLCIIEGGMNAIKAANIPVKKSGRKIMSLERQVRIVAGFLVLVGVVLGSAVNINFYGLAGFVGAGLMFAGITDTCMMGMLIARMPWNK
jgi:rhodanese-related sulfurtransferase